MPKVMIIIINWNGLDYTLECLKSVYMLEYDNYDIIVIDNDSSDDSANGIRSRYPSIHMIENKKNYGYTGGNNIGIRYAIEQNADYVWLLNNDTVVEPTALKKIVEKAESSTNIGMVSPQIFFYCDKSLKQFVGSYVDWSDLKILYPDREVNGDYDYCGNNICLWGTALLVKRRTIEKIGYLNDEYFAYWEDIEYSLRAIRAGLQNVVCEDAKIYHKTPIGSSKGIHYYYYMQRNKLLLAKEFLCNCSGKCFFYLNYLSNLISCVGSYWQAGEYNKVEACLNGAWHGVKKVTGQMTSEHPIPKPIYLLFKAISHWHPFFISDIVGLKFNKIIIEIYNRCRAKISKL